MIKVKNEFVVKQSTNRNKKWERTSNISVTEKDAYIEKYREILELINLFGGFMTKDSLYDLLKQEKTDRGVDYILKRLYDKGCLNTFTIQLNTIDQKELNKKEFLVFAITRRVNKVLNNTDATRKRPTKASVIKQYYKTQYFIDRYKSAIKSTFKKAYAQINEDKKIDLVFEEFANTQICDILKATNREKQLSEIGFFDSLPRQTRAAKSILKEHFEVNKEILKHSDEFNGFNSNFIQFEKLGFELKTSILDFIKKYQSTNTIIGYRSFNEYAGKELDKAGYKHMLSEEKSNREYQEQRLAINQKISNLKKHKPIKWKQNIHNNQLTLKEFEKRAVNANLKILKKQLVWDAEIKRYKIKQSESLDSLLRLRDLNVLITNFRIIEKKVYINFDIIDIYYKPMSAAEIVDKIVNTKYLIEALFSFYDDMAVKENDLILKFSIKSFREFKEKKKHDVEMLLRHPSLLMHELINEKRIQYITKGLN